MSGLVSVVIPTHNRAELLRKALLSILAQDYDNYEIIIVIDACTDKTLSVINEFNDDRIKIINSDVNLGGAQARNVGIKEARGEYIAFLDDDDEWMSNKLSEQIAVFDTYDDIAIVTCNYNYYKNKKLISSNMKKMISIDDILYYNYCGSFSFCITKSMHIKELIDKELKACQDWDLWIKILKSTGLCARSVRKNLVVYNTLNIKRLTTDRENAYSSYVIFLKAHWNSMNQSQKYYNLFKLVKLNRVLHLKKKSYLFNIKVYYKALRYYYLSGYDQNIYNYIKFLPKLFKYH